jgi:membrane fusion protein, heavy metal efflux system
MKLLLLFWSFLVISSAAVAHEGHDKAFANKDNMVATNQKVHIAPSGQSAIGLKAQAVTITQLKKFIETTGIVAPADNKVHYVTSPVGGIISSIDVQVNDTVRKGQRIATVYSADIASVLTDLLDQRASLQAEMTKAKAQAHNDVQLQTREVEHFTIDADRQKKLFTEGVTAQRTYLDAAHALDMAKSKLEGTKMQLAQNLDALNDRQKTITDATKRKLTIMGLPMSQIDDALRNGNVQAKVPIISPADGTVYSRDVSNGESIQNSKKLLSIVMLSPIWITLNVNQEQLDLIKIGQEVSIKPPVGPDITGKISSVASIVDPVERTVHSAIVRRSISPIELPGMRAIFRISPTAVVIGIKTG